MDILMLPKNQRIFLQVGYVIKWRPGIEFEHQPADVGVKKTLGDAIRIFIVIDMLMMRAVLASPEERRVFKSSSAEDQRNETHDPVCLEGQVREQPVITNRYRKAACAEHDKKKDHLEPIDPEEIEIAGHRGQREKQSADEKRARRPIDIFERDSREHRGNQELRVTRLGASDLVRNRFASAVIKLS
jgi:hypothetical protein